MDIHKANIEKLKWSLIKPGTNFTSRHFSMTEVIKFRRKNMTITDMIWITQQPVMDSSNNLYNPKTLIMLILN